MGWIWESGYLNPIIFINQGRSGSAEQIDIHVSLRIEKEGKMYEIWHPVYRYRNFEEVCVQR